MKKILILLTSLISIVTIFVVKGGVTSIAKAPSPTIDIVPYPEYGAAPSGYKMDEITSTTTAPSGATISLNTENSTKRWRNGIIEHWYNYKITSFKKIKGVYSHFGFYGKRLLEQGDASFSFNSNYKWTAFTTESMAYSNQIRNEFSLSLYATFEYDGAGGEVRNNTSIGMSYVYNYTYSTTEMQETFSSIEMKLDSDSAKKYCPEGYNIAIGQYGTYYLATFEYQEYENYWWGKYPCGEVLYGSLIIANPMNMAFNYVISKAADSAGPYYYYVG